MMKTYLFAAALVAVSPCLHAQDASDDERSESEDMLVYEPIVVTAEFRDRALSDVSGSTTVIGSETLRQRNADHIERVLNLAPNVNFATGASRGRFFQIRGIGERSQFVEPMNASVGLLIDGIDLTGLGGAATTVDIEQVEVLRGPQGTLFGANALAGMINMVSGSPTDVVTGRFAARLGDYGTRQAEGMLSGPLGADAGFRVAYSNVQSDGYQANDFLGVDDNAAIDEQTLRTKLRWQPAENLQFDLTGLLLDIDNRYDGFSLDNTRTTLSDEPGFDRQETAAGSLQMDWQASDAFRIEGLVSRVDADLDYGYDEDWSFVGFCEVFECVFDGYSSFDRYIRSNDNTTLDLRAVSAAGPGTFGWVVGAYARDQVQELQRVYTFQAEDFFSDYDTENRAVYGRIDVPVAARWTLVAGLRYERRDARYADSDGAAFDTDEGLWGGRLALEYRPPADSGTRWPRAATRPAASTATRPCPTTSAATTPSRCGTTNSASRPACSMTGSTCARRVRPGPRRRPDRPGAGAADRRRCLPVRVHRLPDQRRRRAQLRPGNGAELASEPIAGGVRQPRPARDRVRGFPQFLARRRRPGHRHSRSTWTAASCPRRRATSSRWARSGYSRRAGRSAPRSKARTTSCSPAATRSVRMPTSSTTCDSAIARRAGTWPSTRAT